MTNRISVSCKCNQLVSSAHLVNDSPFFVFNPQDILCRSSLLIKVVDQFTCENKQQNNRKTVSLIAE